MSYSFGESKQIRYGRKNAFIGTGDQDQGKSPQTERGEETPQDLSDGRFRRHRNGEKEIYVAYMSEPSFPQFSKFMAASKKDEVIAMRTLARDCFVDGDKELVDDESLFLFGLMGQLSELITTRQSVLVNL